MTWDMGWAAWPGSGSKISPFSPCQEDSKGASMEDVDDDDDDALKAQRRVLEGPGRSWKVQKFASHCWMLLDLQQYPLQVILGMLQMGHFSYPMDLRPVSRIKNGLAKT